MSSTYLNDDVNIYKPVKVDNHLTLPLCSALLDGNVDCANKILEIYESDLQFIANYLKCHSKFWLTNTIFIGFGNNECKTVMDLYDDYQRVEPDQCVNKENCVVILLKRDNLTPMNVMCLSPKRNESKLITLRMVKCVYLNDVLDINAKNGKGVSLLCATATSGMFDLTIRLLRLGTEIDILQLASFSMLYGQLKYLDTVYKRFGFEMYDLFMSNEYFSNIFGNDNWSIFEYVVQAIMMEKQLSWRQIVNYIRIIYKSEYSHNTVFHHAIENHHYKIATKILQYSDCQTQTSQCTYLPIKCVPFRAESVDILGKLLEIDPTQFEIVEDNDEERYAVGILHRLLTFSSFEQVKQIYEKYPSVKDLFFKNRAVGLKYMTKMLSKEQYKTIYYVLENSSAIPRDILYELLKRIASSNANGDIVGLFQFVMSMTSVNYMCLPIEMCKELVRNSLFSNNYRIFRILLMECDLNQLEVWHSTNLLTIVLQRTPTSNNIFNILLQNQANFKGIDILHHSVAANNFFTTKKLLELGMDVNKYDKNGKLPIHHAKSVEIFELLITWSSKSFVNFKTKYEKFTPLHCCVTSPPGEATNRLIRFILDNGGNINAKDIEMKTPLFLINDLVRANLLLERNPDITVIDKKGNSIINHILTRHPCYNSTTNLLLENKNLLQLMKSQPDQIGQYLLLAINKNYALSCELLKQPGLDMTICDGNKNSLLHLAIQAGNLQIIDELIEKGVPLDNRNQKHETPLLVMCRNLNWVNLDHITLLLKYSPDINARDNSNWSPILHATRQYREKFDIVLELLINGANILDCPQPNAQRAYDYLTERTQKMLKFLV